MVGSLSASGPLRSSAPATSRSHFLPFLLPCSSCRSSHPMCSMLVVLHFQLPFSFLEDKFHEGGKLRTVAPLETLSNWHRAGLPNKAAREAAIKIAREVFLVYTLNLRGPKRLQCRSPRNNHKRTYSLPCPKGYNPTNTETAEGSDAHSPLHCTLLCKTYYSPGGLQMSPFNPAGLCQRLAP